MDRVAELMRESQRISITDYATKYLISYEEGNSDPDSLLMIISSCAKMTEPVYHLFEESILILIPFSSTPGNIMLKLLDSGLIWNNQTNRLYKHIYTLLTDGDKSIVSKIYKNINPQMK